MPVDETYYLKQGESIPDYNSRIAAYNASKAQPSSQPTSTTSNGSNYYPRYTANEQAANDYINNFQAPQSEDAIYGQKLQQAQGEIDNLNKLYDQKLQEQDVINQGRNRQTSSINTLTGLAGSTEANTAVERTDKVNKRENDLINAERQAAISNIFARVRSDAAKSFQSAREEARMSAEQIMANRKTRQEEATKNFSLLAQSGMTMEGLKQTDPESYRFFAEQLGGEQMMSAIATLNRPQETILDKKMQGGKYIVSYQNPLTGKVRIETVDLGLPPEYSQSFDVGDRLLFAPDGWDGDTSKLIAISKGLTPSQALDASKAGASGGDQLYSGLSSATATAVRSKVGKYSSEPLVQNFATIQEGYNFAKSIDTKTTNPADDQALIYSLAKTLDPGSVVREGEYATAQKYAQSWVNAYGKGITQALAGTGFLSEAARNNIKNTIETKYKASKISYDNTNKQYIQNINSLTGRNDGGQFLVDYAIPQGRSSTLSKDGQTFDASDLTDEEYQQAIDDGYTE